MKLCGVLREAAIAQLLMAEAVLDDVEGMLDHGAYLRERPLDRFGQFAQGLRQRLDDAALDGDVPGNIALLKFGPLVRPGVAGIAEDVFLFAVQQRRRLGDVGFIGGGPDHRVHQPRGDIDPDVGLHPEVPLRPRPLHRPTRTTAAQNRPAACVPTGSAADRARLSDRAGRGVPPAGATALPAPSRLEIYRAASASFCRRTPPRQNSPAAASICLRHNTGQILPNPGPETGLFQRIPKGWRAARPVYIRV